MGRREARRGARPGLHTVNLRARREMGSLAGLWYGRPARGAAKGTASVSRPARGGCSSALAAERASDAAVFLERADRSSAESPGPLAGRRKLNLKSC